MRQQQHRHPAHSLNYDIALRCPLHSSRVSSGRLKLYKSAPIAPLCLWYSGRYAGTKSHAFTSNGSVMLKRLKGTPWRLKRTKTCLPRSIPLSSFGKELFCLVDCIYWYLVFPLRSLFILCLLIFKVFSRAFVFLLVDLLPLKNTSLLDFQWHHVMVFHLFYLTFNQIIVHGFTHRWKSQYLCVCVLWTNAWIVWIVVDFALPGMWLPERQLKPQQIGFSK